MKEKIYRCLFQSLAAKDSIIKDGKLTFKVSEIFKDYDVVSRNDLKILIKHLLVSELR